MVFFKMATFCWNAAAEISHLNMMNVSKDLNGLENNIELWNNKQEKFVCFGFYLACASSCLTMWQKGSRLIFFFHFTSSLQACSPVESNDSKQVARSGCLHSRPQFFCLQTRLFQSLMTPSRWGIVWQNKLKVRCRELSLLFFWSTGARSVKRRWREDLTVESKVDKGS